MVSIDGDTSTNDTVLLLANGAGGGTSISDKTEDRHVFEDAVQELSKFLAKEIARDGEGADKLIEVNIGGALTEEDARLAAKSIASSILVKSAVHGGDPNWGRIVVALGFSGAEVREDLVALYINEVCIMEEGRPIPFFKDAVVATMNQPEIDITVNLNLGEHSATAWGCDITEEYVTFNSAYTT